MTSFMIPKGEGLARISNRNVRFRELLRNTQRETNLILDIEKNG